MYLYTFSECGHDKLRTISYAFNFSSISDYTLTYLIWIENRREIVGSIL